MLQGSSSHRGQQSPGASGKGLSHVNGGHSNFQQSNSPYWISIKKIKKQTNKRETNILNINGNDFKATQKVD